MSCKDCIHYEICEIMSDQYGISKVPPSQCGFYKITADVVEVVRCKDCKYWQDNNGGYPHEECRWGKDETPDADDYCSYGERSKNGT